MRVFVPNSRQRLHVQVAQKIRELIARRYQPGEVLPTYPQLAERFNCGVVTVRRAVKLLAREGILTPIRRKGTVVKRRLKPGEARLSQIALILPSTISSLFRQPHLSQIAAAIFVRLDNLQAEARVISLHGAEDAVPPSEVLETGVDGAVLLGVHDNAYIGRFAETDVPLVVVDHHAPAPADYVVCDNAGAASAVVGHLASLGHRRLAYVQARRGRATDDEESDAVERREGFARAVRAAGLAAHDPVLTVDPEAGREALAGLLAAAEGPGSATAVVTYDEAVAEQLVARLAAAGRRVPQDVSVAAVAGPDAGGPHPGGLTCCRMDFWAMGTQAMEVLELRCRSPRPAEPSIVRIGFRLDPGSTVGRPAGGG